MLLRAAWLRQALAERFEGWDQGPAPDEARTEGWTELCGPVRCESRCTLRERRLSLSLTHPDYETSVLGPGWTGGCLRPGVRVASPRGWRAHDQDRGYFLRLRPSLPTRTLTICGGLEHWGCGCGAGAASLSARFDVDPDGFVLAALSLRVLRTPVCPSGARLEYPLYTAMPRLKALALVLLLGSTAHAAPTPPPAAEFDYQQLLGLYGFEWFHLKRCVKVDPKLLQTLKQKYTCEVPTAGSSSGRPVRFSCTSKDQKYGYLLFAAQADCKEEYETQKANGG